MTSNIGSGTREIDCKFSEKELSIIRLSVDTIVEDGIQSPFSVEDLNGLSHKIEKILYQNA